MTGALVIDPLMGWFVLRLLADFFFRADNLAEAIAAIRPQPFIASWHAFIAGSQQLTLVLLPGVKCFLFLMLRQSFILDNFLRLIELSFRVFNLVLRFHVIIHWMLPLIRGGIKTQWFGEV